MRAHGVLPFTIPQPPNRIRRVVFSRSHASILATAMMLQQTLQPGSLLLKAQSSQASPLEDIDAIHALYQQRIFRFLYLSLRDRDAAMSLTQDTFLNAWRYRSSFRGDCSVPTWLTRIAVNLLRSHTRTETFRFWKRAAATAIDAEDLKVSLPSTSPSAETSLLAQEQLAQLWSAVELLSSRQRTIFLLRFVDELELAEIALVTGLSLPTVKSHLYRALDHVRATTKSSGKRGPA